MKVNVISAFGDPRDGRTWSGTTKNVTKALEDLGILERAFEALDNNLLFKTIKQVLRLYYKVKFFGGRHHMMMPFRFTYWRNIAAYSGNLFLNSTKSANLLHFSTLSLPKTNNLSFKKNRHFLMIDATWDLWANNSTNINLISQSSVKVIERLERISFDQSAHIFTVSEYVKKNLIHHYNQAPDKITVVGTGTGIIKPYFGEKDYTNKKILFVAKGRFEDKGGYLVLDAFERLLRKFPDAELNIVGQNDYSSQISHSKIKTYGFLPLDELQGLFNACTVFVMPALFEPWGLVYIEAMLCKMPIIGLNRNAFPEICNYGEFGIGVDIVDSMKIAEALDTILSNPEATRQKGEKAQKWAIERYTWVNVAKKISKILSND